MTSTEWLIIIPVATTSVVSIITAMRVQARAVRVDTKLDEIHASTNGTLSGVSADLREARLELREARLEIKNLHQLISLLQAGAVVPAGAKAEDRVNVVKEQ